jgi:hypothetical protein
MAQVPMLTDGDFEIAFAADPGLLKKLGDSDTETRRKAALEAGNRAVEASVTRTALTGDKWCYRLAIIALGAVVALAVMGAIALAIIGHSVPEILIALGSAAVGALAGLVSPNIGAAK